MSGGMTRLPRHRAPFAACLFFSRRGVRSLWKSCPLLSSKKKKGKRRKKRNRDSTLNRSMEVHDPARLQPLIHSRPHSLCFLLSATRFERPDDDFTRYPLLYFCFGLSLSLSMSAVTRWRGGIIVDDIWRRAEPSSSLVSIRVITSNSNCCFPVLDKFPASDAPVNKFES